MNEGKRPDKYLGYKLLDSIYGDDGNLYWIYRKIVKENGDFHGLWAAAPHADDRSGGPDESKMFDITYAQARGFEPISETSIGKLRRTLGKKLLPQRESIGKKRLSERKNSQAKEKESAKIREIIDILEAPRGLAKKYGYTLTPEYVDINHGGRWPITKLQYNRLKELGYGSTDESLNESIPAKAKKEIADWWKEVEAWNEKKKEFNISNDYDDVEGMHSAMFDMLDELKSKNKDLYEKGRKIYNKYSDVPIKKSKVREAYEDEFDDDILEDEGAETVIGIDDNKYAKSSSKSVRDSDGFMTDYTAWIDLDNLGHVIFIFGDNDLYNPSNESPDWECDSAEEAQEWFDNYTGFDDEDYEDYYEESLNKSKLNESIV